MANGKAPGTGTREGYRSWLLYLQAAINLVTSDGLSTRCRTTSLICPSYIFRKATKFSVSTWETLKFCNAENLIAAPWDFFKSFTDKRKSITELNRQFSYKSLLLYFPLNCVQSPQRMLLRTRNQWGSNLEDVHSHKIRCPITFKSHPRYLSPLTGLWLILKNSSWPVFVSFCQLFGWCRCI